MTVTVEVIEKKSLNLLDAMENMGLIHVLPSVPQESDKPAREGKSFVERMRGIHAGHNKGTEDTPPYNWLRGIHAGHNKGTVDDFLKECHEEKERENAIDRRQDEERERMRANAKLPS